jgi:hypothetical protein
MSGDDTVAGATEPIDPPPTGVIYAWQEEIEEEVGNFPTLRRVDGRIIPALIAAVAVAAVSVAGTLVLTPGPDRFTIRPAPIQQVPPPKAAPAPKPQAPVAAPPAEHLIPPAPQAPPQAPPVQHVPVQAPPPPNAGQQFSAALAKGGMWKNEADDDQQARDLCQDLANGQSVQPYISGTLKKSPQLTPAEAAQVVRDAIQAYCPQYAER